MRIIHAVGDKAVELGGDVRRGIEFWDEILRVEFGGSISKLREALGGDKGPGGGASEAQPGPRAAAADGRDSKRQRKELLQWGLRGLEDCAPDLLPLG